MEHTYNDILNGMKAAFFRECGKNPDTIGDIGARFSAVASEVYSLCCRTDYIRRQSFVQTATGEGLDNLAAMHGIARKGDTCAVGVLTFSVDEPSETDIVIDAGSLCSMRDMPFVQFATDRDCVITAGALSVDVPATALGAGEGYNAPADSVTVMVNVPIGVSAVTNKVRFSGGYSVESDEALRRRVMDSFRLLPTGISRQYMRDMVMSIDCVRACSFVQRSANCVDVYVIVPDDVIGTALYDEISDKLAGFELNGIDFYIHAAGHKLVDITVRAHCNDIGLIGRLCYDYVARQNIGEVLDLCEMRNWLVRKTGEDEITVTSDQASGSIVPCMHNERTEIGGLEVFYE